MRPKVGSIPARIMKADMYSGRGHDTVGPQFYSPNVNSSKKTHRVNDFVKSKITRTLFEPSIDVENKLYPPRDNPGPGFYDENKSRTQRKTFHSQGNDSIFLSTVPNCKDAKIKNDKPGPG